MISSFLYIATPPKEQPLSSSDKGCSFLMEFAPACGAFEPVRLLARASGAAGELLLGDFNEALRYVAAERTGIAGSHIAVVAVLRDLDAECLRSFEFHLLKRCLAAWNDEAVGAGSCHGIHLLSGLEVVCSHCFQIYASENSHAPFLSITKEISIKNGNAATAAGPIFLRKQERMGRKEAGRRRDREFPSPAASLPDCLDRAACRAEGEGGKGRTWPIEAGPSFPANERRNRSRPGYRCPEARRWRRTAGIRPWHTAQLPTA
ncbi:hypothetical protein BN871_EJ_00080 [Paenibacillus sp. P22]|nr:hypothetical protein BN871_EJ_00080 [Paenibacillus sp. P22]